MDAVHSRFNHDDLGIFFANLLGGKVAVRHLLFLAVDGLAHIAHELLHLRYRVSSSALYDIRQREEEVLTRSSLPGFGARMATMWTSCDMLTLDFEQQ